MQFSQLALAFLASVGAAAAQGCAPGSYRCDKCEPQDLANGDRQVLCAYIQVCDINGNWVTTHNCPAENRYWWCRQEGQNFRCA